MSDVLAIVAAVAGLVMATAPVLQIRRMLERRSSADVSLSYLTVLLIGFFAWIAYGLSIANMTLVIPNSVATVVTLATIAVAWRFRSAER